MSAERKPDLHLHLEIAHVLFIDVVGYSKLLADEQSETLQLLNQIVRGTAEFRTADEKGELIRLPTGDGMALVFLTKPEAPVQCALEISEATKDYPELQLRMGIHSGSVNQVTDVNDRLNVTGAGINMAQRVMDCGDAGHILLSQRVAGDLAQYRLWQPRLHDVGECEVKHGVRVHIFNLYTDEIGNPAIPAKLKPIAQEPAAAVVTSAGESARSKHKQTTATVWLMIALALGFGFWIVSHRGAPKSAEIGKPLDLPALAEKARGAVVLIMGHDAAGKIISGSGFFVSADGRLVTNGHVVEGIVSAQAKLESGAIYNIDGVLASSSALDLAVLKADARDMQFLLVDDASNPPEPGTRIAVIGSPLALEGSLSEGIVSAIRSSLGGSSLLQISAPISPGSSGSPVLDWHGRVVGVATLTAEKGQNLNFARSSHDLRNFLQTIPEDATPKALSEKKDPILSDPDFVAAREANNHGDGAGALKLLNALAERYPSDPRVLFQLGCAYEILGLHDEAYDSYREYIAINPTDAGGWHNFAKVAANLNKISEAINACTQAVKIRPDASTWRMLGDLYSAQGQNALSVHAYDEAKRLDSRPVYVVVAPDSKGLNIHADHRAKAAIVARLQQWDRVFLEEGHFRNTDPPYPITWQKVTSANGDTGWMEFDYLAPVAAGKPAPAPLSTASPLETAGKGSPVRGAILDGLRASKPMRELSQAWHAKVVFTDVQIRRSGDWAWVSASPMSEDGSNRAEPNSGVMRNSQGQWAIVEFVSDSIPSADDPEKEFRSWSTQFMKKHQECPGAIFPASYLAPSGDASNSPPAQEQEVRELFKKWLTVSNADDTAKEASLYADPVDYLDFGKLSRHQLVQNLQQDLQRWPKQHYTISKEPLVEKLSESEWRVTFEINFDVRDPSKGQQVTGTANLTWTVRKRESGGVEIASSKEQVTR